MNSVATVKQERVQRARRWCLRVIAVIGGAIAASVAACALTTAAASADQANNDDYSWLSGGSKLVNGVVNDGERALRSSVNDLRSNVDRVQDSLRTNNEPGPVKDKDDSEDSTADGAHIHVHADGTNHEHSSDRDADENPVDSSLGLSDSTQASADGIAAMLDGLFGMSPQHSARGDLSLDGAIDDAAQLDGLRNQISHWLTPAATGVLPDVPVPGGMDQGAAPMPMPLPSAPSGHSGVGGSVVGQIHHADFAVKHADSNHSATGDSDRGTHHAADSDVSDSPSDGGPIGLPTGAPGAPAAPGTGNAGGHADGSPFAVTSGSGIALGAIQAAKAVSGAGFAPIEPGRQPGVTPD